jgi:hypothetical protein
MRLGGILQGRGEAEVERVGAEVKGYRRSEELSTEEPVC